MELHEKITKETDDNALYTLLGVVLYTNLTHLYNRLKKDEIHPIFYKNVSTFSIPEKLKKAFVEKIIA